MTVIAALTHNGNVYMAADTVATMERRWYDTHKIMRKPVGTTGTHALLAFCGRSAIRNAVDNDLLITAGPTASDPTMDLWAHELACAITDLLTEMRPPLTHDNGTIQGNGLLAYKGRLWSLETNVADRCGAFECIGNGDAYALGALYALEANGCLTADPNRSVRLAVEAASRWDAGCGGPIDIEVTD